MNQAINYIKQNAAYAPTIGVVLGSGLHGLASSLVDTQIIKYSDIPGFINTSVKGHAGEFILGRVEENNLPVIFANGRFHYYEGLDYNKVHILVDVFNNLGCKSIITTNSSGCLEPSWVPGDLMIIDSHIDMTFRGSAQIPDKKTGDEYYSAELEGIAKKCMNTLDLPIRKGTYGWTLGPTYETPAEIKLMQSINISAVGMSTVPEIERAHELNMNLLGVACLTNYAVGISENLLTHEEVVSQANKTSKIFSELILQILKESHRI